MNNFKKDMIEFKFIFRQGSNLTFKVQARTAVKQGYKLKIQLTMFASCSHPLVSEPRQRIQRGV